MAHDATHAGDPHVKHVAQGYDDAGGHAAHGHGTGEYWVIFALLMVLLFATVGAAYVDLKHFNVPVAYAIASLKAGLILWYFMHLKYSTRLTQVFAFASFAWVVLMLIITLGDYVSRTLLPRADVQTTIFKVDSYERESGVPRSQQASQPGTTAPGTAPRGSKAGSTDHKD